MENILRSKKKSGMAAYIFIVAFSFLFASFALLSSRLFSELVYNGNRSFYSLVTLGISLLFCGLAWICRIPYKKSDNNLFKYKIEKWGVFFLLLGVVGSFAINYFLFDKITLIFDSTATGEFSGLYGFLFNCGTMVLVVINNMALFRPSKKLDTHIAILRTSMPEKIRIYNGFAKTINTLTPFVLCIYCIMVILPWIYKPTDIIYNFLNNGLPSLIYRAAEAGIFVIWTILIMIANKKAPSIGKWIGFALVGGVAILAIFKAQRYFSYEYLVEGVPTTIEVSMSLKDIAVDYASVLFSIYFAFSLMFIIPLAKGRRKIKNIILWLFVILGAVSIAYSFYAEFDLYKSTFADFNGKYAHMAESFFNNKNTFAALVMSSFLSSLVLAYNHRRFLRILLLVYTFLTIVFEGIIMSLTPFFAGLVVIAVLIIWLFVHTIKKKPILISVIYAILLSIIAVGVCFVTIPELYSMNEHLSSINKMLFDGTLSGRTVIWNCILENADAKQTLLGNGPIVRFFTHIIVSHVATRSAIDNGYIYIFEYGGVAFVGLYAYIYIHSFKGAVEMRRYSKPMMISLVAVGLMFAFYSLAEASVFGLDSSLYGLLPSILFLCYPRWIRNDGSLEGSQRI